jgi:peptidoglycan/xylan/chitin deacetylase (PgdA/CDA1 family)
MMSQGERSISILMYHSLDTSGSVVSVSPQHFSDQMACLSGLGYKGISLREALDYRAACGSWPAKSVVLTFDDGFANFYNCAYPVLSHHKFTATVFLVSGYMGGYNGWETPPPGLGRREVLSWDQAAELASSGIEMGAHTRTHVDLSRQPVEAIAQEMIASRSEIEKNLKRPVEAFAYPFGNVTRQALEVARCEFRAACTTILRRAKHDPLHSLPRVDMYYVRNQQTLERLLAGELDGYLTLRRAGRKVRRMAAAFGA